jgi:CHAT domain-containing protein
MKGRKRFFFEKQNQKTLTNLASLYSERPQPNRQKSFAAFFQKRSPFFLLCAALAAACAKPPADAYFAGAGHAAGSVAVGSNAAGEACLQAETEPGREYVITCGNWKQPSATLRRGDTASAAQLASLATASPWRRQIDATLTCEAPAPATILGGPAMLLRCNRRMEGFPQAAFVALIDGRVWFADGVPAATPVMEKAIALDSGRIAPGSLGAVQESPGLAAERLAARTASANDAETYRNLARTAVRANLSGQYASAEIAYGKMAALQRRVLAADNPALTRAMALQALQISNQGRYNEARILLARAEHLAARSTGDNTALAQVWHYQGLNLLNQNKPRDALPLLRRAEAAYLTIAPDSAETATPGDQLIPTDQTTRAAAFGVLETRRAEAVAYRMLDQLPQSEAAAHGARAVMAAYGLSNAKASARVSRTEAMVLEAAGDEGGSLRAMELARLRFARALPGSRAYAETLLLLAARQSAGHQTEAAVQSCRQASMVLKDADAGVDIDTLLPCLDLLAAQGAAGNQTLAGEMFELAEQAQGGTTSEQIAQASARLTENARDPRVAKLISDHDDANAALAQLYARQDEQAEQATHPGSGQSADLAKQIEAMQARRDSLEQALQSASPNYGQLVQKAVTAGDVMTTLRPREAFSAIVVGRKGGYNFLFYNGRLSVLPIAGGARKVDDLVARVRRSMDDTGATLMPFDAAAASELYALLFGGAAPIMTQAQTLTVAPGGSLLSIPFGLLLTGPADASQLTAAPWLIRRLVISHVPAPANFVQLRRNAANSRASRPWFGFGEFRPVTRVQAVASFPPATCGNSATLLAQLPPLPGTQAELALAAKQLGASTADELVGADFTAAAVQAARLADYKVLHFATHAILQTDLNCQTEPALVTSAPAGAPDASGALLTASAIAGMKLDADAVLLSACNTGGPAGSSPGESLSGLARSFFFAGARSLLVTHWDVNDKVTSVLVGATLAYAAADPSLGMAAALANAQRKLLDRARDIPSLAHPFYWAPLALIGEGRSGVRPASG